MKILNFGSCNIDHVYSVLHITKPGETVAADVLSEFPGGKGLNQSVAIARSGEKVYHAGCIGKNDTMLEEFLISAGVDTRYLKRTDEVTGHAIIQVDDSGENSIIIYHGANYAITKEYIDEVLEDFDSCDVIVLQNEISNLDYVIEKAYKKNMTIILNPSPIDEEVLSIDLNKISVILLNRGEGFSFTGEEQTEKICDYFIEHYDNLKVVLTLGKDGCCFIDCKNKIKLFCPVFKTEVKDTTGAGDTFTGYFVSAFVKNMEMMSALKYSSAASSIAVSRDGAASSIPLYKEVEDFIKANT